MQVSQRILIRADLIEDGGIDPPDLLLREPSAGVQHRITVQLDGAFTVDEVLLRCLAREKIKLPLRFVLCGQRAMTHVDPRGRVGDGWPVVDIALREGRGAASFHRLTQSLNRVIESGGQIAWISPPAIVILSRYDSRESGPTRRIEER